MPLHVASRRRTTLRRDFPDALIIDVTSRGTEPWICLSPFYPHGGIPVPGHPDRTSQSVEGVWQALKVFTAEQEDLTKLDVTTMKGIKRTARRLGPPLGHRLDGRLLRKPALPEPRSARPGWQFSICFSYTISL